MATEAGSLLMRCKLLNGTNFVTWKRDITMVLYERDLYDLVAGTEVRLLLTDKNVDLVKLQENRYKKGMAIIFLSLEEQQKSLLNGITDPVVAWKVLHDAYQPKSMARVAALWEEFFEMRMQSEENVSLFYARMKGVVQNLKDAGKDIAADDIAFNLIRRMPKQFDNVVQSLYRLSKSDFQPDKVYEALVAEEGRLLYRHGSIKMDPSEVLYNETNLKQSFSNRKCYSCHEIGHISKFCPKRDKRKFSNNDKRANEIYTEKKAGNPAPSKNQFQKKFSGSMKTLSQAHMAVDVENKTETTDYCMYGFTVTLNQNMPYSGITSEFLFDSGASNHFCNNKNCFSSLEYIEPKLVQQGKGNTAAVGIGSVTLKAVMPNGQKCIFNLQEVYYVPELSRNLISVAAITSHGHTVLFKDGHMSITNKSGNVISIEERNHLYPLYATPVSNAFDGTADVNCFNTSLLWHQRMCHIGIDKIKDTVKKGLIYGVDSLKDNMPLCHSCKLGKAKCTSSLRLVERRSKQVGELVHVDLWGPSPVTSMSGKRYYMTVVDDYSRWITVMLLKTKGEALLAFAEYVKLAKAKWGHQIQIMRSDNGTEFVNSEFSNYLSQQGIKHQVTNAYTPAMNGVAESVNRYALDGVRTMLIESELPGRFWGEALMTYIFVKNRIIHAGCKESTPYEMWYGRKPTVKYFRRFGCLTFSYIPQVKRHKLQKRAKQGIMLGYAIRTKGYRIYDPETGKVIETKHVSFDESVNAVHLLKKEEGFYDVTDFIYGKEIDEDTHIAPTENDGDKLQIPTVSWRRNVVKRKEGKTAGQYDTYYYPTVNGVEMSVIRSRIGIKDFCESLGIPYNTEDFKFANRLTGLDNEIDHNFMTQIPEEIKISESGLCAFEAGLIPETFDEALCSNESNEWKKAMDAEINAMHDRKVWEVVDRPEKETVVTNRWVFVKKRNTDGTIKTYKARLVAHGYKQIEGVNWFANYSPTVDFKFVKLFFTLFVCLLSWCDAHLDIRSAYLYSDLTETVYMEQPQGYSEGDCSYKVLRLKKAIYGLRQAGRAWFLHLEKTLQSMGFVKIDWMNCAYCLQRKVVLLYHVDDFIVFACNNYWLENTKEMLRSGFEITDLGSISCFLGLQFERTQERIVIHQKLFIENLVKRYQIPTDGKVNVPLQVGVQLSSLDSPKTEQEKDELKHLPFRSLIGSLLYLANRSRPDIMYAVVALSQFCNCFSYIHWNLLLKLVSFVYHTRNYGINLSKVSDVRFSFYSDASWATCVDTRKSFSGFMCCFGGVPIHWGTSKQKCIAQSTMESEYVALCICVNELVSMWNVVLSLKGLPVDFCLPVCYCDNQAAISFVKNKGFHTKAKHIDIKYHVVKDLYDKGFYELVYISSDLNLSDCLSKALSCSRFKVFTDFVFEIL